MQISIRKWQRIIVTLATALIFSSPAEANRQKPEPAPQVDIDYAEKQVHDCLEKNYPRFEDGVSDAATIGRALAGACRDEIAGLSDITTRGENDYVRNATRAQILADPSKFGISAVLQLRAAARQARNPQP